MIKTGEKGSTSDSTCGPNNSKTLTTMTSEFVDPILWPSKHPARLPRLLERVDRRKNSAASPVCVDATGPVCLSEHSKYITTNLWSSRKSLLRRNFAPVTVAK